MESELDRSSTGNDFLVLADDLSGATDCVAAFANEGSSPVVHLWPLTTNSVRTPAAIDLDTRGASAEASAATVRNAIGAHFSGPPTRLYKKIDSTLRGHIAVETAAALEMVCAIDAEAGAKLAVIAPAYPKLHRAIRNGRLILRGKPAEATSIWASERAAPDPDLPAMLERVGLPTVSLGLSEVRSQPTLLRNRLSGLCALGCRAVVCDAETDDDLFAIARASVEAECTALWVGSAGLAKMLGGGCRRTTASRVDLLRFAGPVVTIVGSASEVSRQQARALAAFPGIATLTVPRSAVKSPDDGAGRKLRAEFVDHIEDGRDVLLLLAESADRLDLDRALASAAGRILRQGCARIGAIVVTGGETARAVFDELGIVRLAIMGELEDGVVAANAEGSWEGPVVIKAGAFGNGETLLRVRVALAAVRTPAS